MDLSRSPEFKRIGMFKPPPIIPPKMVLSPEKRFSRSNYTLSLPKSWDIEVLALSLHRITSSPRYIYIVDNKYLGVCESVEELREFLKNSTIDIIETDRIYVRHPDTKNLICFFDESIVNFVKVPPSSSSFSTSSSSSSSSSSFSTSSSSSVNSSSTVNRSISPESFINNRSISPAVVSNSSNLSNRVDSINLLKIIRAPSTTPKKPESKILRGHRSSPMLKSIDMTPDIEVAFPIINHETIS